MIAAPNPTLPAAVPGANTRVRNLAGELGQGMSLVGKKVKKGSPLIPFSNRPVLCRVHMPHGVL